MAGDATSFLAVRPGKPRTPLSLPHTDDGCSGGRGHHCIREMSGRQEVLRQVTRDG